MRPTNESSYCYPEQEKKRCKSARVCGKNVGSERSKAAALPEERIFNFIA
jgi:hypothetical protein